MASMDSNARWQQMAALRDEIDQPAVVIPICVSRLDGRPHELSPKARRVRRGALVHRRVVADHGRAQPPGRRLEAEAIRPGAR